MKLIDNLPNHLRDKNEYLLSLKDSIAIPIICIRCGEYGHHVTDCRKEEKTKKEKTKKKQDKVDIKPVTLQELLTEAKMVKQEIKDIKEDNSIDINEQNIAEIINLKEFSKPMTEPPSLQKDNLNNDSNRQNTLSLTNKVIPQKGNTKIINKEFLTEVVLIELETDNMNERFILFKNEPEFEELTQTNKEKLIMITYVIEELNLMI